MENIFEIEVYQKQTGMRPYIEWLSSLRDSKTLFRIEARINSIREGNFGDHKSLGDGLWELRLDFGPGYRIYYAIYGGRIVLLLAAGEKSSQSQDIHTAKQCKIDYEERQ